MEPRDAGPADIEVLVRETLSSVAVAAFARGVGLSVHIDATLPVRVTGETTAVGDYLRRGLARTIEAERTARIALALWRGPAADAAAPVLLEISRPPATNLPAANLPAANLAASAPLTCLWALPLGEARAEPRPHRQEEGVDSVLVPLPLRPDPGAPPLAERWRPFFQGRYMLHLGDPLFDPDRLIPSLGAIGLEVGIAATPEAAVETARRRAAAGKPVDLLLIEAPAQGAAAIRVARTFRRDPRLAGTLIALAGAGRDGWPPPGDEGLFDATGAGPRPWRRLIEVFRELIEARTPEAGRPAAPAKSSPAISSPAMGSPAVGSPDTTSPAASAAGAAPAASPGVPDLTGRRILIAEDVETNQVLLRALLEPTGAGIETVSGGEAVCERHAAEPVDLIVMDLQMPGMGGIAAARRLRALPGEPGQVPIVALTAYAGAQDRQRGLAAGMDAYLAKPVVISEFYDVLRRLLPPGDARGGASGDAPPDPSA